MEIGFAVVIVLVVVVVLIVIRLSLFNVLLKMLGTQSGGTYNSYSSSTGGFTVVGYADGFI
jgi:hypothetical protein